MIETTRLDAWVERAREGDRDALEALVGAIKDDLYGLALRMLWHPDDAEDATQEILIKVITHLGAFRQESAFRTWVFRIAVNHLLTTRKRRAEREEISFDRFADQLGQGLSDAPFAVEADVDQGMLVEEVKLGCTHGMLLCLDREHRLAYILGEIFALTGEEAAEILQITPVAFRKRLSRARERVRSFMRDNCGLVDPANACRCQRRVNSAIQIGRVDPRRLLFAGHPTRGADDPRLLASVREMEALHETAALYRGHPDYAAPGALVERIKRLLTARTYALLQE